MKIARRSLIFGYGICFALLIIFQFGGKAAAATCGSGGTTCPYFKTFGDDVFTGGWFNPTCAGSNYQNSSYGSPSPLPNAGGILAYAKTSGANPAGGASSQYGAFALGNIDGSGGAGYGFYSAGAAAGGLSVNQLSFANSVNAPWGGQFEGTTSQLHCIPDYYTDAQQGTIGVFPGNTLNGIAGGEYSIDASGAIFNLAGGTVNAGQNIDIFVKGNVYISGSVAYAAHTVSDVPKFRLIVQGNIYIAPGVNRLDGWYIAQPASGGTPSSNDGIIWSCHPNDNSTTLQYTFVDGCTTPLVVNGALVAKQITLTRIKGDLSGANTGEDNLGTVTNCVNNSGCNVAEVINYTPDMIIDGPFGNSNSAYTLDSLASLPPVF